MRIVFEENGSEVFRIDSDNVPNVGERILINGHTHVVTERRWWYTADAKTGIAVASVVVTVVIPDDEPSDGER